MSRAIGSFLILILVTQQTYCQSTIEWQILQRLERLERAKEDLENKNTLLTTRFFTCSKIIDDTLKVNPNRYCLRTEVRGDFNIHGTKYF